MGSPLSSLMADIYLNDFENKYILSNLNTQQQKIVTYSRYVDDTFIIFDGTHRQIEIFKNYINSINDKIKFTAEIETDNEINFLDLTIKKNDNKLKYKIYRKPTTTDITIHNDSHHPYSQKMAAYYSLVHRLITIPMDAVDYQNELNIIKQIARSNGYQNETIDKIVKKRKNNHKTKNKDTPAEIKYTSVTFTNILPQIIKNEFKKFNINVSFKTNNNIQKILQPKTKNDIKTKTGVYKIKCDDCNKFYIGQTGRTFYERFKEHKPKENTKSNYAIHLIENNHNYTDFESNLSPMHLCKKGRLLDALEEFEIYKARKTEEDKLLNDKLLFKTNPLYDTALKHNA